MQITRQITRRTLVLGTTGLLALPRPAAAEPKIGASAPGFVGQTSTGIALSLDQLHGKIVVLEWTNDGCPFVRKWYGPGAMQALQKEAAERGIVWVSVISSRPGMQGHADAAHANLLSRERGATPAHVVLDPNGAIGRLYAAAVTPTIVVIKTDGTLAYIGGADSIASTRQEDLAKAEPYARDAIRAVADGKPVARPVTRAYGCVIHYQS